MSIHRIIPSFMPMAGITLFGQIFVQKDADEVTIAHEERHVLQQRRDGWRFYFRYAFSAKWRVAYEAEAYAVNLYHYWPIEELAKDLSSWLYLKPCSYDEAVKAITDAFVRIQGELCALR